MSKTRDTEDSEDRNYLMPSCTDEGRDEYIDYPEDGSDDGNLSDCSVFGSNTNDKSEEESKKTKKKTKAKGEMDTEEDGERENEEEEDEEEDEETPNPFLRFLKKENPPPRTVIKVPAASSRATKKKSSRSRISGPQLRKKGVSSNQLQKIMAPRIFKGKTQQQLKALPPMMRKVLVGTQRTLSRQINAEEIVRDQKGQMELDSREEKRYQAKLQEEIIKTEGLSGPKGSRLRRGVRNARGYMQDDKGYINQPLLVKPTDLEERERPDAEGAENQLSSFLASAFSSSSSSCSTHADKASNRSDPSLCKIQRDIWVKRTRFYPLGRCAPAPGEPESRADKSESETAAFSAAEKFYSQETDLCCMWCTLPIVGLPIPLARRFSEPRKILFVQGQFCSFECMLARAKQLGLTPLARFMMSFAYGIKMTEDISPSPSPFLLTKFNGPMTPAAYRNTCKNRNVKTTEIGLPFAPFSAGIQEVERIRATIYEFGDETRVKQVVNSQNRLRGPSMIENVHPTRMQRSRFVTMPTLEEQIAQSQQKLRLQLQELGHDEGTIEGQQRQKKSRTLRDFMKIKR